MCTICGGTSWDDLSCDIFRRSKDRGRDYGNLFTRGGSWICNHRAIPTTETLNPCHNQPFGTEYKIVHNGVISNDKELGNAEGEIDSSILASILDPSSCLSLAKSLRQKVKGSYALAIMRPDGSFYLACNYKPIWYCFYHGELYFSSLPEHLSIIPGHIRRYRVEPYTVMDMKDGTVCHIPREVHDAAIVIASGGLDSTAVAAFACKSHKRVRLLHFQYGCKAEKSETNRVRRITDKLKQINPECEIDCDFFPLNYKFAKDCSLLKKEDVITEGVEGAEYAHEWVPARNLVLMAMSTAYAEANKFSYLYLGTNLEEGGAYPDNEEQFIRDFNSCLWGAVQNGNYVQVRSPLGNLMKHEIVLFGKKYDAPFEETWSCYRDGDKACGHCGPCYMRQKAFYRNGMEDPVNYVSRISSEE